MSDNAPSYPLEHIEPVSHVHQPTDVWVALKSGSWNVTNGDVLPDSRVTRAIIRGLLLAALEQVDDWDSPIRTMTATARSPR